MEIEQEHCKDMDQEKFHRVDGAHAKQDVLIDEEHKKRLNIK